MDIDYYFNLGRRLELVKRLIALTKANNKLLREEIVIIQKEIDLMENNLEKA